MLVEGDLQPGNSPAAVTFEGNLALGQAAQTEIELGGLNSGEFDQLLIAGDLGVDGELSVSLLPSFSLAANQEFEIAAVGGTLDGMFTNFDEGDSVGNFGGQELFITYGGAGGGNGITLFTTVPEPASGLRLAIGTLLAATRRRTRMIG